MTKPRRNLVGVYYALSVLGLFLWDDFIKNN
jgi:hypothetical protein